MYYLANIRMPTERAHGAQVVKMCEAFARAGEDVMLVVPHRKNPIKEDPFSYYGYTTKPFKIQYVPVWDTVSWGKAGFLLESFSFAWHARREIKKDGVIYGRDELVLFFLSILGYHNIVWESHTGAWNIAAQYLAKHIAKIVVISTGLEKLYVKRGLSADKLFVAHDGVTVADFDNTFDKDAVRKRLGLPLDKKIALYIGGLDEGKGADVFCKSAAYAPDVLFVVIGGSESQLQVFKNIYPHVLFVGPRPYRELPENQALADVLVVPNSVKLEVWSEFTSPLKLFAALASRIPVVASATPSILEVIDQHTAYMVTPDDPKALAEGISKALAPKDDKTQRAWSMVTQYDWQIRAKNILAFINK